MKKIIVTILLYCQLTGLYAAPVQDTIYISSKELGGMERNSKGLLYMSTSQRKPLGPGIYAAATNPEEEFLFTVNKDSLLDGHYQYHNKKKALQSAIQFSNGAIQEEWRYKEGKLLGFKLFTTTIAKKQHQYTITKTTIINSYTGGFRDSVILVYHNEKPAMKTRYRNGKPATRKDFTKNIFERYNSAGKLQYLQKAGLEETYNTDGVVIKKKVFTTEGYELYEYGKLREKQVKVKGEQRLIVSRYDEKGNIISETSTSVETAFVIADPDEYESDLKPAELDYLKQKAK